MKKNKFLDLPPTGRTSEKFPVYGPEILQKNFSQLCQPVVGTGPFTYPLPHQCLHPAPCIEPVVIPVIVVVVIPVPPESWPPKYFLKNGTKPILPKLVHIQGWLVDGWYVIMGKVLGIIHTQTAEVEPEVARVAIKLAILVGNIEQFTHRTLGFGWPVKPDLTVHARGVG